MGMFDRVKRDAITCPTCGETIDDFQTKSGICQLLSLTEDELIADAKRFDVERPYYYGFCPSCGTEVSFEYVPGHWEQEVETKEQRQDRWKKADDFWKKQHKNNNV